MNDERRKCEELSCNRRGIVGPLLRGALDKDWLAAMGGEEVIFVVHEVIITSK